MGRPDMLCDVLDVDTMADSEVGRPTCAGAGTNAAGPSTDDATQAVGCGVFVDSREMLSKNDLVDGDSLATVVDHAAHGGRRCAVGNRL
jgi:hypothetical protein